jgi:hypothetical protein
MQVAVPFRQMPVVYLSGNGGAPFGALVATGQLRSS